MSFAPEKSLIPTKTFDIEGVEYHLGVWENPVLVEVIALVTYKDTWRSAWMGQATEGKVVSGFGGYLEFFQYVIKSLNATLARIHPDQEPEISDHLKELSVWLGRIALDGKTFSLDE